jgi:hypothetical protein
LSHRVSTAPPLHAHDCSGCFLAALDRACESAGTRFSYRARDTEIAIEDLTAHHVGFEKFVTAYFLSPKVKKAFAGQDARRDRVARDTRRIAGQVEKLAPAVDPVASPSNAEYPWMDGDRIVVPCDHDFPNLTLLKEPGGRAFLKLMGQAMDEFGNVRIH